MAQGCAAKKKSSRCDGTGTPIAGSNLKDLPVLVIDCQTTGGAAATSYVVELGWQMVRAADPCTAQDGSGRTLVLRLPAGETLSRRISRLTGLEEHHMSLGVGPDHAWEALVRAARATAAEQQRRSCLAVIHYGRFEGPFLERLHQAHGRGEDFPLEILCTHELTRRLLPGLRRKGLRAVAGYLGFSLGPLKRCADHVTATAFIWRSLVDLLAREHDLHSLEALLAWLHRTPVPAKGAVTFALPRQVRLALPRQPGIYRFLRANGDLLYIGKAGCLHQRVNSYFWGGRQGEKTLEMLTQAARLETTATPTALEAALLESEEIKRCRPPYNIALMPGQRTLFYVSRDFGRVDLRPTPNCPLGPVPSPELFTAAHLAAGYLEGRPGPADEHSIGIWLGLDPAHGPDQDCMRSGLALFKEKYGALGVRCCLGCRLRQIGRRLWQERLALGPAENGSTPQNGTEAPADEETPSVEAGWSPEGVLRCLESNLRRSGHYLRRAAWYRLLSEAVVAWQGRGDPEEVYHGIVFRNGAAQRRMTLDTLPAFGRFTRPGTRSAGRKRLMDLAAYDRFRVLTTELRRFLAQGRHVSVYLNRRAAPLTSEILARLLPWV